MHKAAAMQRLERGQNRQRDLDRFGAPQWTPQQPDSERLPLEEFHDQEQLALLFADVVELAHIGMIEAGGRSGLAPQAVAGAIVGRRVGNHLERDTPVQTLVVRSVDHAHPAFTELARDAVVTDSAQPVRFERRIRADRLGPDKRSAVVQPRRRRLEKRLRAIVRLE
jgi:hypothetical protein